jgi:hypothetical protein
LLIALTEAIYLYFQSGGGIEVILASLLITTALFCQLAFGLSDVAPTPADQTVLMFSWLFLDLAPKMQLLNNARRLVNTSTVHSAEVLHTNAICALFIVIFTITYNYLMRRTPLEAAAKDEQAIPQDRPYSAFGLSVTLIACLLSVLAFGRYGYGGGDDLGPDPLVSIVKKVFLFLPTASLFILVNESVRRQKSILFGRGCILLFLLLMVLATQSPLTEKRNTLGPVYLGLMLVTFDRVLRGQNRRLILLTFGMVLIFPVISIYTHSDEPWRVAVDAQKVAALIENHYTDINYDAWANIYATIELVARHGMTLGHQLLGTILFYVPRSIWHAKPITTGAYIAEYLIANYTMWFNNLSAPLIAEGYIDFGVVGVAAYALSLALGVHLLDRLALHTKWSHFPIAVYFSVYLMYVLRGALMPAIAYGVGQLISFALASTLLSVGRTRSRMQAGRVAAETVADL